MSFTAISNPVPAGRVEIVSGFSIELTKMPNWFHMLMMRIALGWRFVRYK